MFISQPFKELQDLNLKFLLITPKYFFDTKLSMFGLAPSATKEGAEGPQKGPKDPPALRRSYKDGRVVPRSSSTIYWYLIDPPNLCV